jgi:signal transduction histidine kinase
MASSGLILALFGISAWLVVCRTSFRRIDDDMFSHARRHLMSPWGFGAWDALQHAFDAEYRGDVSRSLVLLAKVYGGNTIYVSPNWPAGLSAQRFRPPDPMRASLRWPPGPDEPPPGGGPGGRGRRGPPPPDKGPGGPPPGPGRQGPPRPDNLEPPRFSMLFADGRLWRFGEFSNGQVALALGCDLDVFAPEVRETLYAVLLTLPVALLLIGWAGWLVSERALRPVGALAEAAEHVTAAGLDRRLPSAGDDLEFARLITVFNEMLDRLEKSFRQANRFSADAAHELKTPLTILQGELDESLQDAEPGSDAQRRFSALLEEVHRLNAIVRGLLLLSMADAGKLKPNLEPHNLTQAVEGVVDDAQVMAPHLDITADLAPDVFVLADPNLLTQVVRNLVGNAVKYNRAGGSVRLELSSSGGTIRLRVSNTGPGIGADDRVRVFDRFYRGDQSHGREVDGVGLGLSLSREIARAHGGDLTLEAAEDGVTTFLLSLPALRSAG